MKLTDIVKRVEDFNSEAHVILSAHETSPSRVVILENTFKNIKGLSLDQASLFINGLRCIEHKFYRASHVMAWSGFIDFLHTKFEVDKFVAINRERPKANIKTREDIGEKITEFDLLTISHLCKLISKAEMKSLKGDLSKRNECAHPTLYLPGLNESIGYLTGILSRIENIQKRKVI